MIRTGDTVMLTCEGRSVVARVVLASANGVSLFLQFEAILHGHAGSMPVLRDEDGVYRSLIGAHPVGITERQ